MEVIPPATERYPYDWDEVKKKFIVEVKCVGEGEDPKKVGTKIVSLASARNYYTLQGAHVWLKPENSDIQLTGRYGRLRAIDHAHALEPSLMSNGFLAEYAVGVCLLPPKELIAGLTDKSKIQETIEKWWADESDRINKQIKTDDVLPDAKYAIIDGANRTKACLRINSGLQGDYSTTAIPQINMKKLYVRAKLWHPLLPEDVADQDGFMNNELPGKTGQPTSLWSAVNWLMKKQSEVSVQYTCPESDVNAHVHHQD